MAFQHIRIKNTSVSGKVPTADKIDVAELCVNLKDRKLYSKDADDNIFELGGGGAQVPGGNTPPPSGNEIGDLFFDTTLNQLLYWDGTAWVPISGDEVQNLDDLKDVVITNPQDGELLVWNGSNWVNSDPGYVTDVELNNILEGKFPDGTPNPDAEEYLKAGDDVSELVNDAGYLTEETLTDGIEDGTVELPFIPTESWADITAVDEAEDADYIAINRGDVVYKITAEDLGAIGSKPVFPQPDEIVSTPNFQDGTGTELDPYILTPITVRPAGASGQTVEYITIDVPGSSPGQLVSWTDNSTGADARFAQPAGVTGVDGTWSGRLVYNDIPATTDDQDYTGDIQIGNVYFQWVVSQGVEATRPINPNPNEITSNPPFESGTGTEVDPYVLRTITVAPAGGTGQTQELLTIAEFGAVQGETVRWIDNSVGVGNRFVQPEGVVGPDGTWSGRLFYTDDPNSTVDVDYTGNLQIGATSVYFLWTVEQKISAALAPTIENITLIEADPEGDRFTSQSFVASVSMEEEGLPISTKTFTATVTGDITQEVQFIEPLESSGTVTTPNQNGSTFTVGAASSGQSTDNFFTEFGSVLLGPNSYSPTVSGIRCTLQNPIENVKTLHMVWGRSASLQSQYWAQWVRVGASDAWIDCGSWSAADITQQKIDWPGSIDVSSQIPSNGIVTTFEFGMSRVDGLSGQTANQDWGGLVVNGKTVISLDTLEALTFAAGTDMDALAPGDNISQPVNFTEPLESSGEVDVIYNSRLTSSNGFFNPNQGTDKAFDGDTTTFCYSAVNGALTFDAAGLGYSNCRVRIFMNSLNTQQRPSDSTGATWTYKALPGQGNPYDPALGFYGWEANITGDVGTLVSQGLNGNGGYIGWIQFDDEAPLENNSLTTLTFPAATDMAALAPGDDVSQGDTWVFSAGGLGSSGSFTQPYDGAFDGNPATITESTTGFTLYNLSMPPGNVTLDSVQSLNVSFFDADNALITQKVIAVDDGYTTVVQIDEQVTKIEFYNAAASSVMEQSQCRLSGVRWNGIQLVDGQGIGTTGTVESITGTTATLSSSTGAWTNGVDVTTGDKTTSGTVGSITDTTVSLSSSTGTWVDDTDVTGPKKVISLTNTTKYLEFNSNGDVLKLLSAPQEPAYTTQDTDPQLTLKFPAVFPSGEAPDTELGEGTVLNVCVEASNTAGSDGPECDEVQPEATGGGGVDVALGGLTTLYTGKDTGQTIVNGINLADNDGLVWVKSRDKTYFHNLFDTNRGVNDILSTNATSGASTLPDSLTAFNTNGFTIGAANGVNDPTANYVSWTFAKAAGYFDVVQFTSDGSSMQTVPHSLETKPGFIIAKALDTSDWRCYHSSLGNDSYTLLNMPYSKQDLANSWQTSDTAFGTNSNDFWRPVGTTVIAYLFAEDTPGVIKCGTSLPSVQTEVGFEPQWVLLKSKEAGNWIICDNKRSDGSDYTTALYPDDVRAESGSNFITFNSTGFSNNYANDCIYVAIAAPPTARSMTQNEFTSQDLKFQTYNYREAEYQQDLVRQRSELIDNLGQQGYTSAQILEALE